jgi:hypothetical protein
MHVLCTSCGCLLGLGLGLGFLLYKLVHNQVLVFVTKHEAPDML